MPTPCIAWIYWLRAWAALGWFCKVNKIPTRTGILSFERATKYE